MAASSRIRPVILSGGNGTRLWPLSRRDAPKQFQALTSEKSLFRETVERFSDRTWFEAPLAVCNHSHADQVERDLMGAGIGDARIVLEPCARNTAPAIVATCLLEAEDDPWRPLLFLPSDHWTAHPEVLIEAVIGAAPLAADSGIVLFGIRPDRVETGYGYIRLGDQMHDAQAYRVEAFVEKPHREVAVAMIAQGQHVWNSGIFLFSAATLLAEADRLLPDVVASCRSALAEARGDRGKVLLGHADFAGVRSISIDQGIMERTARAVVVPVDPGWSDIGSWPALYDLLPKDSDGNAAVGRTHLRRTRRCLVRGGRRLIATLDVADLLIVDTDDALLVAHKEASQEVRTIVEDLAQAGAAEAHSHPAPPPALASAFRSMEIPAGGEIETTAGANAVGRVVVLSGAVEIGSGPGARIHRLGDVAEIPPEGTRIRNRTGQRADIGVLTIRLPDAPGGPGPDPE